MCFMCNQIINQLIWWRGSERHSDPKFNLQPILVGYVASRQPEQGLSVGEIPQFVFLLPPSGKITPMFTMKTEQELAVDRRDK